MRGVTAIRFLLRHVHEISTHTPHARRDDELEAAREQYSISTHTPHARRDYATTSWIDQYDISTHTPHARRDFKHLLSKGAESHFNSHASCEA